MTRRHFGLLTGATVARALLPVPDAADVIIPDLGQVDARACGVKWCQGHDNCHRPAGWGTNHHGEGHCRWHDGPAWSADFRDLYRVPSPRWWVEPRGRPVTP